MSICARPEPVSIWRIIWNLIVYNKYNFIYKWWFARRCKKFTKIIFPVIEKSFPEWNIKDILSVQPMTAPTGPIFYMNCVYKRKKRWQFWKKKEMIPIEK